jgi:hypothetical protein
MRLIRTCLAALAAAIALGMVPPAANAQLSPGAPVLGACGDVASGSDSGLAGVENKTCAGSALVFNGPAIGRIAVVVGPTIISPGFAGVVAVSSGSVFIGPGAGSEVGLP